MLRWWKVKPVLSSPTEKTNQFGFINSFVVVVSDVLKAAALVLCFSFLAFLFNNYWLLQPFLLFFKRHKIGRKTAGSIYTPLVLQWGSNAKERREWHREQSLCGFPIPFQEIRSCYSGDVQVQLNSHPHWKKKPNQLLYPLWYFIGEFSWVMRGHFGEYKSSSP